MNWATLTSAKVVGWALVGVAIVFVLIWSPSSLENFPTLCLFQRLLDVTCWGCGLTRAASSLVRAQFGAAWEYNPLIYIVAPLVGWTALQSLRSCLKDEDAS